MGKKKSKKASRSVKAPVEDAFDTVGDIPAGPPSDGPITREMIEEAAALVRAPGPLDEIAEGSTLVQGPAAHDPNRIIPLARITASAWSAANLHFIHAQGFNAWAGLKKLDRLTSAEWQAHYAAYTNSKVG